MVRGDDLFIIKPAIIPPLFSVHFSRKYTIIGLGDANLLKLGLLC